MKSMEMSTVTSTKSNQFILLVLALCALSLIGCTDPEKIISTRLAAAEQKIKDGETPKAIKLLKKLNKKYPERADIVESLAFAYAAENDHSSAAWNFIQAADLDDNKADLRQFAAQSLKKANDNRGAIKQYRLYLSSYPIDFASWLQLGELLEEQGTPERAVEAYISWYQVQPSGEAAYRIAMLFTELGNYAQARSWLRVVIDDNNSHLSESMLELLRIDMLQGDFSGAEKKLITIDQQFPDLIDSDPHSTIRQQLLTWKESRRLLQEVQQEQKNLSRELKETRLREEEKSRKVALELEAKQKEEEAKLALIKQQQEEAESTSPLSTLDILILRAHDFEADGHLQEAIQVYWQALALNDTAAEQWAELSNLYRKQKQLSEAESCILEAQRRDPENIVFYITYLNIIRHTQTLSFFITELEAARIKYPRNPSILLALAQTLGKDNFAPERAAQAYEDFLLLTPENHPDREEANAYLNKFPTR
ncbi:MAG: tetratricopeptide repeat protein [Opitutaceae bacterium]|nr:tetratricopeptide repeat protein [Opitutaceae bacterium]